MSKTLLIVIGIACAVISAAPFLAYGITDTSLVQSTGAMESGFMDASPAGGFNIDSYTILLALTIVLLLAIIIDALATKRKSKLNNKIQETRDEIKAGTHIVKDNRLSVFIKPIQWASLSLFVFFIVGFIFVFLDSVFWIHVEFKFVWVSTAILVLLMAEFKMLSARRRARRPIIIKRPGNSGNESRNILILVGIACAVLGALFIITMPKPDKEIPILFKQLSDKDPDVRIEAAEKLAMKRGNHYYKEEAARAMISLLKDKNHDSSGWAMRVLELLHTKNAIPEIIPLLKDDRFREMAVSILINLRAKEAIPYLIPRLKSKNTLECRGALRSLERIGDKSVIPEIIPLLKRTELDMRDSVIKTLVALDAKDYIGEISGFLKDKNYQVRGRSAIILVKLGANDKVPKEVTEDIKLLLAYVGSHGMAFAEDVLRGLGVPEEEIQQAKKGKVPPEKLKEFIARLDDKDVEIRLEAIDVLYRFRVKEAAPGITKLLLDSDSAVRHESVIALCVLEAKETIPEIKKLLLDPDPVVRSAAIHVLGNFQVKESQPEIIRLLQDNDPKVRRSAIFALGKLSAKEAIPEITKFLQDNNLDILCVAVYTLGELGAKEAIPEIIKLLHNNNAEIRRTAIKVLGKLDAQESIPLIKELLKDKDNWVRYYAERTLRKLGVSAEEIERAKENK